MLATRLLTAAVLGPVVLVAAIAGDPWLSILLGVVVGLGMIELVGLLDAARFAPPRLALLVGGSAIGLASLLSPHAATVGGALEEVARATTIPGLTILVVVAVVLLLAIAAFAHDDPRLGFLSWATSSFGAVYVGLLVPMIAVVAQLGPAGGSSATEVGGLGIRAGAAWTLTLIALVWGYDTGAYATGRWLGRRHLIDWISPSKTVEGLVGGLVLASVAAALGTWLLGIEAWHALLMGPLVGLAAQAGDLAESLLKRAAGAKESGSLIPGHGGILDRVDSFLFAAPVLLGYALLLGGASVR